MGFLARLFQFLFGGGKKSTPTPSAPPQRAPSPPAMPRTQMPSDVPPPPSQAPIPPGMPPKPAPVSLDDLRAVDTTKVTDAQIAEVATRLSVEPQAIHAIAAVESAKQGFGPDGRVLIAFDGIAFTELSGAAAPAGGNTQPDRWTRLTAAFAINPAAALQATNFGLFQTSGAQFAAAGYADALSMAADVAQSETRQLVAFEQFVRSKDLMDELRNHDWAGFAAAYHPATDPAKYSTFVQNAFVAAGGAATGAAAGSGLLASLVAKTTAHLTADDIAASAARMQCEPACVRAVLKVESGGSGFGSDGRPLILYEPHIFSRITKHIYDTSHPKISYLEWKTLPYPKVQADRYKQLAEAYTLDPEAAVAAASWGLFQILGSNYKACGFSSATAFVADIAQSEVQMLKAFENFVTANKLLDALRNKKWADFAKVYNGPGQVDTYSGLLKKAYDSAVASA